MNLDQENTVTHDLKSVNNTSSTDEKSGFPNPELHSTQKIVSEELNPEGKFYIDRNAIHTIPHEEQETELQLLGLSVYDQETFEQGILQQVDRALDKQKRESKRKQIDRELDAISVEIHTFEENLKKQTSLSKALIAAGVEGLRQNIIIKKDIEVKQKQLDALFLRRNVLRAKRETLDTSKPQDEKTNENTLSDEDSEQLGIYSSAQLLDSGSGKPETEMEKKIRQGEMTPFGSVLGNKKSVKTEDRSLTEFERYLESQTKLQQTQRKRSSSKDNSQEQKKDNTFSEESKTLTKIKKSPLKLSILAPKKRKRKEKLGSSTSDNYWDQAKKPGKLLSEKTALDDDDSEYIPSEEELLESEDDNRKKKKWDKPTVHRMKKRKKQKFVSPPEDWASDDSDWEYSDEESRAKKRRSKKEIDDGNADDFMARLKMWEECCEEERPEGDEELEGGYKIPKHMWNKLYDYQKVGVQWLWELHQQRCGGILGDEMGLGKTVQVIAFLAGLSHSKLMARHGGYRGLGPVLIVCPTTVMHQWVREFHIWWPPFRVAILHESGSYEGRRESLINIINSSKGILVTSYVGAVQHKDILIEKNWHYIILDEGHKIRNPDAQVTLAVKMFRTPHRIILSGSPMQNSLKELWSLFDFVFPGKLGTLPVFLAQLAVPITQGGYANASQVQVATAYRCATVLRDTISPYLLRRMKTDVKAHIQLPQKTEHVLFCRLTDEQRMYYKSYLDSGEVGRILQGTTKVFLGLITLRKICNHPDLYSGGPKLFKGENEENIPEENRYGHWKKSGKMIVIESLLRIWHKQGHRVLLFTQSRQMLCILESFVQKQGYTYLKLDGGTSIASRQPLIAKFNQDTSFFVFLLTTRVGGLGVNLTGADRVVIYDPDWNPATDTQARERAWRIGQKKQVTVYRLITAGTIEEKVYHRQIFKQFLSNKVLQDPRQRRFFKSNDLFELFTLKETDEEGSTETSAIFAGTGSEVKVNFKQAKHNVKNEKFQKHDINLTPQKPISHKKRSSDVSFSQSKLEQMKQLAQKLSKQIGDSSTKTTDKNSEVAVKSNEDRSEFTTSMQKNDTVKIPDREGAENFRTCEILNDQARESAESSINQFDTHSGMELVKDQYLLNEDQQHTTVVIDKNCDDESNIPNNVITVMSQQEGMPASFMGKEDINCKTVRDKIMNQDRKNNPAFLKKHKKHKHSNKNKLCQKRTNIFEGESVPHLVGQRKAKPDVPTDSEDINSKHDDYVLKQLFKRSGLQTALKHDTIMQGGDADYALVEGEAQKVAREAVKALKESREQCFGAGQGIPTWTGQHGAIRMAGQVPRLTFAKKKKNATATCSSAPESPSGSKTSSIFNGRAQVNQKAMSSSELLARIRARNSLLPVASNEASGDEQDIPSQVALDNPNVQLLTEIRNFIAYGACVNGKASTQEIVNKFKERLPPGSSPLFKFLLQEICEFQRTKNGEGVWKLRTEFRNI